MSSKPGISVLEPETTPLWTRRTTVQTLLGGAGALAFGALPSFGLHSQVAGSAVDGKVIQASLSIASTPGSFIPADFTGLSYETSQLIHPSFFSGRSQTLARYFRLLGPKGVLRIGGNLSEFSFWNPRPTSYASADGVEGPDPGRGSDRNFDVTPKAIDNLAAFLKLTDWKLIYGLNLAQENPEAATEEAVYVANATGTRLVALQFGNEPDLFKHDKDPKNRWTYQEFIDRWQVFYDAVRRRLPDVVIAGPDTSFQPAWTNTFASEEKSRIGLLTSHYYAGGPPTDPKMTTTYLLEPNKRLTDHVFTALEAARANGLPYRMSEGNTCYGAGKKGVSDTFASALWAAGFFMELAKAGATGLNLHGGGNGFYTPIAGSPTTGFTARPVFYGMMLAGFLANAQLLGADLESGSHNMAAYATQSGRQTSLLLLNREPIAASIQLDFGAGSRRDQIRNATVWRMQAPALDSTSGVTLGGAAIDGEGHWSATSRETVKLVRGTGSITMAPYSAVLLRGEIL